MELGLRSHGAPWGHLDKWPQSAWPWPFIPGATSGDPAAPWGYLDKWLRSAWPRLLILGATWGDLAATVLFIYFIRALVSGFITKLVPLEASITQQTFGDTACTPHANA
jgi:hypothetical protein